MQTSIRSTNTNQFARWVMVLGGVSAYLAFAAPQSQAQTYDYIVSTFAGSAGKSGTANGAATNALFNKPSGICAYGDGSFYIADFNNSAIRLVAPNGTVTTPLGLAGHPGTDDGKNSAARFNGPLGLAMDTVGNTLYVSDYNNNTIRQVVFSQKTNLVGLVSTLTGSPTEAGSLDGLLSVARFNGPSGLALDSARNLYVADRNNHTVRKITLAGQVTTIGGVAGYPGTNDGVFDESLFNSPTAVAVDSANNVYVVDSGNFTIRKITPAGIVSTVAGVPGMAGSLDGPANQAMFKSPVGIAMDKKGAFYVTDADGTIRGISPAGMVYTMAGVSGTTGTNDGLGSAASLSSPVGILIDSQRVGWFTDSGNNTVRQGILYETTPIPPTITSVNTINTKQAYYFQFQITASGGQPYTFGAVGLPPNIFIDPATGLLAGVPSASGKFLSTIYVSNAWGMTSQPLTFNIASSIPVITSSLSVRGSENATLNYQIQATDFPTNFGAVGLPLGLAFDPTTGDFIGAPVYAGEYDVIVSAQNSSGTGKATLHLSIGAANLAGLFITGVTPTYSKPYLIDIEFSLRDSSSANAHAVVAPPSSFAVRAYENTAQINPDSCGLLLQSKTKQLRASMVLDYSFTMAFGPDANGNGISDTIEAIQSSAKNFIGQQAANSLIAIDEFHSDDTIPSTVNGYTANKALLDTKIDGILTNVVQGHFGGSRVWDAIAYGLAQLGSPVAAERRVLVVMTDGNDTSSVNVSDYTTLVTTAVNNGIKIYPIGFGDSINSAALQQLADGTGGRFYVAASTADLLTKFASIGKDCEGVYNLRWASLNRSTNAIQVSFDLALGKATASFNTGLLPDFQQLTNYTTNFALPDGTSLFFNTTNNLGLCTNKAPWTNVYVGTDAITTNYATNTFKQLNTNPPVAYFFPSTNNAGNVNVGTLIVGTDPMAQTLTVNLSATYVPRYVRQLRVHYRPNWPCVPSLYYTNAGELLAGWTLTETNDNSGGKWLTASSPSITDSTTSIPFAAEGSLLKFTFRDMTNQAQAFSLFLVDTNVYTTNPPVGQSFTITNTNAFVTVYPPTPHGTPIPWLLSNGLLSATYKTNDIAGAETNDFDKDGIVNWQEFQAGTSPTNKNSYFKVLYFNASPLFDNTIISFSTSSNRVYRVEASGDLTNWTALVDNVPGIGGTNNGVMTFTDPRSKATMPHQYYRVLAH